GGGGRGAPGREPPPRPDAGKAADHAGQAGRDPGQAASRPWQAGRDPRQGAVLPGKKIILPGVVVIRPQVRVVVRERLVVRAPQRFGRGVEVTDDGLLAVRFLRLHNNTAQTLTAYVLLPEEDEARAFALERWAAFHEAVETLPAEQREVVGLTFYHGWTQAEIAALFAVDERTVRRRWQAACVKLNEALGGDTPAA